MNISDEKNEAIRYLKVFSIVLAIGLLFPLMGFIFVKRIHEHDPFSEIVKIQKDEGAIYGTALNPNDLKYKLELYKSRKPDLVIMGSSRAMKFREEFFSGRFINLGGTFSTLNEGKVFSEQILAEKRPQIILLVIDYWWFHRLYHYDERRRFVDEASLNRDKLLKPWVWLFEGKITAGDFLRVVAFGASTNPYNNYLSLGMRAIKGSSGFRYDGSYFEVDESAHSEKKRIVNMENEIREVREGKNDRASFGYDNFVNEERWKMFLSLLDFLRNGSEVVLILPPVSPFVSEEMSQNPERKFVQQLSLKLNELAVPFVDFTDFRKYTKDNREFLDNWHPGEVAVVRQLVELKKRFPETALAKSVKEGLAAEVIQLYPGKCLIPEIKGDHFLEK